MNLRDLVLNYLTDNEEGIKHLVTWFLNEVMDQEAEQQVGAARYQRIPLRRARRNGYRLRTLKSRNGELTLERPLLRGINFQNRVFERYSRTEKALENAILESYTQGVSTRKIQDVISPLGIE